MSRFSGFLSGALLVVAGVIAAPGSSEPVVRADDALVSAPSLVSDALTVGGTAVAASLLAMPSVGDVKANPVNDATGFPLRSESDWLDVVNFYRTGSGLDPVSDEPAWSAGIQQHLDYLRLTPPSFLVGLYQNAHYENPASPFYSDAGAAAGISSNLNFGGSYTDKDAIDVWLQAPFHAIGILRPGLEQSAFARDPQTGGAGLDVIRGLTSAPTQTEPIVFPGDGTTTDLRRFYGELPDPLEPCGDDYAQSPGLPLIAMLPEPPPADTVGSITAVGLDGRVAELDVCTVTADTFVSTDTVYGPTGKSILAGNNGVFVISRTALPHGTIRASVRSSGDTLAAWSFQVVGPPEPPTGLRIERSGPEYSVAWTPPTSDGGSPLTGYRVMVDGEEVCRTTPEKPSCTLPARLTGPKYFDVTAVNSQGQSEPGSLYVILDRSVDAMVGAGETLRLTVPEAVGAKTVIGQLTVDRATGPGFLTAFACDAGVPRDGSGNVAKSDLNYDGRVDPVSSNRLIVKADADGDVCVYTNTQVAIIVDINGVAGEGIESIPNRRTDTRQRSTRTVGAGETLRLTVPEAVGAKTVIGQLTVDRATGPGFLTAFACDAGVPRDGSGNVAKSDLNYDGRVDPVSSNRLIVKADADGDVCVYTNTQVAIIVDINGVAGEGIESIPNRRTDTRQRSTRTVGAGETLRLTVPEAVGAKTVIGQLTVDRATGPGFLTAFACDAGVPRDGSGNVAKSDLNYDGRVDPVSSNRLIVKADADGDVCVYTNTQVAIIVDINGVAGEGIESIPNRRTDTRQW